MLHKGVINIGTAFPYITEIVLRHSSRTGEGPEILDADEGVLRAPVGGVLEALGTIHDDVQVPLERVRVRRHVGRQSSCLRGTRARSRAMCGRRRATALHLSTSASGGGHPGLVCCSSIITPINGVTHGEQALPTITRASIILLPGQLTTYNGN